MATSSKIFILTLVTLAAAASAGATMWISRRRRRPSDDSSADPALPASSTATDAAPAPAEAALATTAIIGLVPILAWRRDEDPIQILPFQSSSFPRFSNLRSARLQFLNRTAAAPCRTNMIVGPVLTLAHVQQIAPPAPLSTYLTRPHQEMTLWWQRISYVMFGSFVSLTGQIMHTCIVIDISFSLSGMTISVSRFIRGPGPSLVMLPPAGDSDDTTTITLLAPVRLPTSVPVQAISPPVPVAGAPRAELAAAPTSTASSEHQLSAAISPCLSRASSAGIFFSSDGLSSDDSFFSSGGSSSSLSRTTSGSNEEIDEISLDFALPISPAVSRTAMSPPLSPSSSSVAPPIPQVDEAAQSVEAWREEKRRLYARQKK